MAEASDPARASPRGARRPGSRLECPRLASPTTGTETTGEAEGEEEFGEERTPTTPTTTLGTRRLTAAGEGQWAEWGGEGGEGGEDGESAEECERRCPVITVLFSRPELWSPCTEEMGAEEELPCALTERSERVCRDLRGPPVPRGGGGGGGVAPADATLNALKQVDFSSTVATLSEDSDDFDEAEDQKEDDVDDTDFEGIARWHESHLTDIQSKGEDEEGEEEETTYTHESVDYTSSEESEIQRGKYLPLIYWESEAKFKIYWELLDPRASVLDVNLKEDGPAKTKMERAADVIMDVIKYFNTAQRNVEESEFQDTSQDQKDIDSLQGFDWFNLPFDSVDSDLRDKIYKKYVNECIKRINSIKKPTMPEDEENNLRNMEYTSGRWIIKELDNEFSFLPKEKKDKILIPADPTIKEEEEEEELEEEEVSDAAKEIPKILGEVVDQIEEKADKRHFSDLLMKQIDLHESEMAVREILEDVRESAIMSEGERVATGILEEMYSAPFESEMVVRNVLDSIVSNLESVESLIEETLPEDKETEEPEQQEETAPEETKEGEAVDDVTILARFNLENERCFSREYLLSVDLNEIRADIAHYCQVPEEMIVLELGGKILLSRNILMTNTTLRDIREEDVDVIDFTLKSIDDLRYPLRTFELTQETPRLQTRTVDVIMDRYETRHIRLTVLDDCIVKPFIGGFRNKKSGIELHHAFSQTGPFSRYVDRTHRDAQTATMKYKNIETLQHRQTQMWRRDCYITAEYDRILPATPYLEADEFFRLMRFEEMAIRIQRYWRLYLLRTLVKSLAAKARECKQFEIDRERARVKEISERHKLILVHKTYPRKKADFDMWFAMIEKWMQEETEIAMQTKDAAGRKASLRMLHLAQVDLLREIDAHRTNLRKEKREKRELGLIDECSKPIEWTGKSGCIVSMDTKRTQRARELRHLYNALARNDVSLEERMEALMQLKYALLPYNKVLPTQLIRLIERESELLRAGLDSANQIDVLHLRVVQLYLQLLKDPDFNPEAAKHILEYNTAQQKNSYHRCLRCSKLKKKVEANLDATTRSLQHCATCEWVQHIGSRRYELGPYRDLMRAIRREEAKRQSYTSVAFVMRDVDFYWLINLWHAESFLTEEDDINEMRMPRWDVRQEWSPWNCILLTDDETKWHLRLSSLEEGYSAELMEEVHTRHVTARLHFSELVKTDKYFRESCKWFEVSRKKTYVAPSREADAFN